MSSVDQNKIAWSWQELKLIYEHTVNHLPCLYWIVCFPLAVPISAEAEFAGVASILSLPASQSQIVTAATASQDNQVIGHTVSPCSFRSWFIVWMFQLSECFWNGQTYYCGVKKTGKPLNALCCSKTPVEIIGKPQPALLSQPATPGTALECQQYRKSDKHVFFYKLNSFIACIIS